jgi:hypothetical protein
MKIFLIILSIIGLLKLVSLFILCIIEAYYNIKREFINGVIRHSGIYKNDGWYLIPTIKVHKYNNYFDIVIQWLWLQYYSSYKVDKGEEEK